MTAYTTYKTRTCKSLHYCAICKGRIEYGQKYYDGGYGKRAHDLCADADELEKQAAIEMIHANAEFYADDDHLKGDGDDERHRQA